MSDSDDHPTIEDEPHVFVTFRGACGRQDEEIVHYSFVEGFDITTRKFDKQRLYKVFWSPNDLDSPSEMLKRVKKIPVFEKNQTCSEPGYYRATISDLKGSKKEVEDAVGTKRRSVLPDRQLYSSFDDKKNSNGKLKGKLRNSKGESTSSVSVKALPKANSRPNAASIRNALLKSKPTLQTLAKQALSSEMSLPACSTLEKRTLKRNRKESSSTDGTAEDTESSGEELISPRKFLKLKEDLVIEKATSQRVHALNIRLQEKLNEVENERDVLKEQLSAQKSVKKSSKAKGEDLSISPYNFCEAVLNSPTEAAKTKTKSDSPASLTLSICSCQGSPSKWKEKGKSVGNSSLSSTPPRRSISKEYGNNVNNASPLHLSPASMPKSPLNSMENECFYPFFPSSPLSGNSDLSNEKESTNVADDISVQGVSFTDDKVNNEKKNGSTEKIQADKVKSNLSELNPSETDSPVQAENGLSSDGKSYQLCHGKVLSGKIFALFQNIKAGPKGDLKLIKNAAVFLFGSETLAKSTVCGTKRGHKKSSNDDSGIDSEQSRSGLDKDLLESLKGFLKWRVDEEEKKKPKLDPKEKVLTTDERLAKRRVENAIRDKQKRLRELGYGKGTKDDSFNVSELMSDLDNVD